MDYKNLLNSEQYNATVCTNGPVLVSAGAGSGKTRLLTYRIAYLITECGVPAHKILAITFTNKAAGEMKDRIQKIVPNGDLVTVSTFHSFCARMLRTYASFIPGYKENFTIFSETDVAKVLKDIFKELKIDDESTRSEFKHGLSTIKNENMSLDEYTNIYSYKANINEFCNFYNMYQNELVKNNAMDFDDLLINFYKLITTNQEILTSLQNKFTYFSVDEFQDTNQLQYDIVKILASKSRNILIVGDEDQSIYGWRGANINNIKNFAHDFPDVQIFKLEQNYRSTKNIIKHANQIIKNNKSRIEKVLFTDNEEGADVTYFDSLNETAEADYVIRKILEQRNQGVPYNEMAILMRLNSLSLPFEKKLMTYNIPYIMYNGFKFYERQEIKNVLSYLITIANPDDNVSFSRIINFPKRGIGETSIEKLLEISVKNKTSLKDVVLNYEQELLPKALKDKLKGFKELLVDLDEKSKELSLREFFAYLLEESKILECLDEEDEKQDTNRRQNVDQLMKDIIDYEEANPEATLVDYLQNVSLSSNMDKDDESGVVVATVHGSKGLEFNTVFVVGCEERNFPITRDGEEDIEEERRLMYVAVTRAKKTLYLTSAQTRFMYGKTDYYIKSRFLKELGIETESKINLRTNSYNNLGTNAHSPQFGGYKSNRGENMNTLQSNNNKLYNYTFGKDTVEKKEIDFSKIQVGAKVEHPKFGEGTITEVMPSANHCVKIKFEGVGEKMLSLDYAPIEFKD